LALNYFVDRSDEANAYFRKRNPEDVEIQRMLKKKSKTNINKWKSSRFQKLNKRKLTKYVNDMDTYFREYTNKILQDKLNDLERQKKSKDPFRSNKALFAPSSTSYVANNMLRSERGSALNLKVYSATLDVPNMVNWNK